jgi:hypothetical protein
VDTPDRPWWQVTGSFRTALFLGCCWLVLGGLQLASAIVDGDGSGRAVVRLVVAAVMLLLAVGYLASGLAQRRRERDARP